MYHPRTSQSTGDKFLGKEVEFYRMIYEIMTAIRHAVIGQDNERFISLVNHLEDSFPYKTEKYLKAVDEAEKELFKARNDCIDKYGKPDQGKHYEATIKFINVKYRELIRLFKEKKIFPQEAEETELK